MAATVESAVNIKSDGAHLPEHNPHPTAEPRDNAAAQPPPPYDHQSTAQKAPNLTARSPPSPLSPAGSNPYVAAAQSPPPSKSNCSINSLLLAEFCSDLVDLRSNLMNYQKLWKR